MCQPSNMDMQKKKFFRMETKADRHAMEIQADRYAADVTLMFAFRELWGQQLQFWSGSDDIVKSLEKRAVQELGAAMTIVFNIVDSINSEFNTHPHPKFRWLAAMMSTLTVWTSTYRAKSKKPYMNPDEFLNLFNAINVDTSDAWRRSGMPSIGSVADLKETDFRNLLERAIGLFPKLDSRFDKQHVV